MQLDDVIEADVTFLAGEPAKDRDLRSRGKQTIGRLLRAGHEVVEERGHDNARVDDIVERAEVSHGTFYLYFRDREDLLESLVRMVARTVAPLAEHLPRTADADALAAWFDRAELALDRHVEVLRAAQSMGDDGAWAGLVEPLADALAAAGGRHTPLVARMLMEHFAAAIVRADIIDATALAEIALGAAGIDSSTSDDGSMVAVSLPAEVA